MTDRPTRYDDIINLPRPVSRRRARMSVSDRAAQFAPFAALTGYESAIAETARQTSQRIELSEDAKAELDRSLQVLMQHCSGQPQVRLTFFEPDKLKEGGRYLRTTGRLRSINEQQRTLLLTDGRRLPLDDILAIECDIPPAEAEE